MTTEIRRESAAPGDATGVEPAPQPALLLRRVGKTFGPVMALAGVDLSVARGQVHCLLGENGAGKSTLCKIIFGVHRPDTGVLSLDGEPYRPVRPADALSVGVAMVHQHFSQVHTMTVADNLMLGQVRWRLDRAAFVERVMELCRQYRMELDPGRTVASLSVGERQRIEILKCLMRDPRVVLLDEPTAVLPPGEIDALLDVCRLIASEARAVILVTHKLREVARVADRATVLRGGRVVLDEAMADVDTATLIRAMVGRDVASLGGTAAATIGVATEAAPALAPRARPARPSPPAALVMDDIRFTDVGGVVRLDGVTLAVEPGEIVGLAGVEGNGQSELEAVLSGRLRATSGRVLLDGADVTTSDPRHRTAAGLAVVPQDRHAAGCVEEMRVAENIYLGELGRFSRFGLLNRRRLDADAAGLMEQFEVRAAGPAAPMSSLSGGNQQRAVLARELSRRPLSVLLAAQPTRGLDVGAVEDVLARLRVARDEGVAVLVISSELDEILAVADRVLVLYRGRLAGDGTARTRETLGALMAGAIG